MNGLEEEIIPQRSAVAGRNRNHTGNSRGDPAVAGQREARRGFLDRMYRIDRMGGSASSDWMQGV